MKKFMKGRMPIFLGLLALCFGLMVFGDKPAYAATKVSIKSVDYYNEDIIINNGSNTKFYFAADEDAANGDWDILPKDVGTTDNTTTMDFSWVSDVADSAVVIKGDVDQDPVRIIIKAKPVKLNIAVDYTNLGTLSSGSTIATLLNIQSTEGTADDPINFSDLQWKKDETGQWKSTSSLTVGLLNKYLIKGTYLYFRICAVNDDTDASGNPDGMDGRRFSDDVKLRVEKQKPAMVYGIDGERFTAAIKYGKEYRVTVTYPTGHHAASDTATSSGWIKVTDRSLSSVSLATIANNVTPRNYDALGNLVNYDGETAAFPKMLIEVRNYSTKTSASSKITEISLDAQRTLTKSIVMGTPASDAITKGDDNIYVAYNGGNKYLTITIPKATASLPYEYCIVKPGYTLNMARASWTSITKGTGVKVLASNAVDGGKLYIRLKEIKSKEATEVSDAVAYALASTSQFININYPSIPEATKANLIYVKGYPTPLVIYATLNVNGKVPYETEVESIKLGTKSIGFTVEKGTSPYDNTVQILKITLNGDDVKLLTNCSNRVLTITYANKTVDKTSKITIKNPTSAGSLLGTAAKGKTTGTTAITMTSSLGVGNTWVSIIGTTEVTGKNNEDTIAAADYKLFTSGADIPVTANSYVTVYEISTTGMANATSNIINYASYKITSDLIY